MLLQTESTTQTLSLTREQVLSDLPQGVPPLDTLYLYVAGSCNLACRHCWIVPNFVPGGSNGQFMKLEHLRQVIEQALPLGLRSIKFTGGEPLLHPQIREFITMAAEAALDIIIETNGTLVDRELAAFLKASGRISFISVSLDGATAVTHEALRMVPGSFQKSIDGIHHLVEAGYRPQIICTLHQDNKAELEQVVRLAESLGCGSVKFNLLQDMGRGEKMVREAGLDVPEILRLNDYIEREIIPSSSVKIYYDIPRAFHPIRRLMKESDGVCNIQAILGMLSSGDLSLCGVGVTIPELIFGNIEIDSLREIWYNNNVLQQLRTQIPGQLEGICGECLHRDTCQGACIANNYHHTKKLISPNQFCNNAVKAGLFPDTRKINA